MGTWGTSNVIIQQWETRKKLHIKIRLRTLSHSLFGSWRQKNLWPNLSCNGHLTPPPEDLTPLSSNRHLKNSDLVIQQWASIDLLTPLPSSRHLNNSDLVVQQWASKNLLTPLPSNRHLNNSDLVVQQWASKNLLTPLHSNRHPKNSDLVVQ